MPYAAIVAKPLRRLCSRIGFDHVNCYKFFCSRLWLRLTRQAEQAEADAVEQARQARRNSGHVNGNLT